MFSRGLNKVVRQVVALTIDFDDGERQTVEFLPGSWAAYRISGNEVLDGRDHVAWLYDMHEIVWSETHWKKDENNERS